MAHIGWCSFHLGFSFKSTGGGKPGQRSDQADTMIPSSLHIHSKETTKYIIP